VIGTCNLRRGMHEIAALKGDFTLFALFRRVGNTFMRPDESPGTWDLVVSAHWLDASRFKAIKRS
jgi:hypothetical protein